MSNENALLIGGLLVLAVAIIATGIFALRINRRPRGLARPEFDKMCADIVYFRKAMHHIFRAQGYRVMGYSIIQEPHERETMMVLFALRKARTVYCVLCVRWFVPVTSDVIERFEKALATTKAERGMIITASTFSPAARERAKGLPVQLANRDDIRAWIEQVWPA